MTLPHALWLSLGLLGGSTVFDQRLADYQWNVTPRPNWGAQVLAGRGPFAAGLRVSRAATTQRIGVPDPNSAAAVNATSVELVGQGRIASFGGFALSASASGGRTHLGYSPDRVEVPTGGGAPVVVNLAPVDAWIGGAGLAVRRPIVRSWLMGASIERRAFGMETAHRNGSAIVVGRESFGDWSARLELAWLLGRS